MQKRGKNQTRRKFLKSAGVGLAGSAIFASQTVSANSDGTAPPSTEELGLTSEVQDLLSENKFEEAQGLLNDHGITNARDQTTREVEGTSTSGPTMSPDAMYSKSDSTCDLIGYLKTGQIYHVYLSTRLNWGKGSPVDGHGPDDGYAISFSGSRWEYDGNFSGKDLSGDIDPNPNGVISGFVPGDSGPGEPGDFNYYGHYEGDLEKRDNDQHNVFGHVVHTWSPFNVPGGVTFSVGIGSLSVSTSGGASSWKMPTPTIEI